MLLPVRRSTEVLRAHLPIGGQRILDVGCGKADLVGWLNKHGASAVGVDPQAALLPSGMIAAKSEALPFGDGCFDSVLFFNSLHHIALPSLDRALAEAARTARTRVIVVEPVAAGSYFELIRPVDDETEVRAAALDALRSSAVLEVVAEDHWTSELVGQDVPSLVDAMIAAEPARSARIAELHDELERRFRQLGRPSERGMLFDQPMRLNLLRHRRPSPQAVQ